MFESTESLFFIQLSFEEQHLALYGELLRLRDYIKVIQPVEAVFQIPELPDVVCGSTFILLKLFTVTGLGQQPQFRVVTHAAMTKAISSSW
jgi:hypothetical protein